MSRTLLGLESTTPTVRLDDSSDNIHQQPFYGHYTGQPALVSTSGTIYFTSVAVTVDSSHMTGCYHPLRGVDSVNLQISLMGMCRQCGSWSVAGHTSS